MSEPDVGTIGLEDGTMALTAAIGDVWQVLIQGNIEGQECENVIYFRCQGGDTDVVAHLLQALLTCFLEGLVPHLASTYTFERLLAKQVSPVVGADVELTAAAGVATQGAESGDAEPSFVSALISLHTTRAGRSGRGRMFIPGIAESDTTASKIGIETPLWAAIIAFVACMIGQFFTRDVPADGNWEWGVMSRKIGGLKPPFLAAGFAPLTRAVPQQYLATTRSRKVGHGR